VVLNVVYYVYDYSYASYWKKYLPIGDSNPLNEHDIKTGLAAWLEEDLIKYLAEHKLAASFLGEEIQSSEQSQPKVVIDKRLTKDLIQEVSGHISVQGTRGQADLIVRIKCVLVPNYLPRQWTEQGWPQVNPEMDYLLLVSSMDVDWISIGRRATYYPKDSMFPTTPLSCVALGRAATKSRIKKMEQAEEEAKPKPVRPTRTILQTETKEPS